MLQLAEECSRSAREHLKAHGVDYIPPIHQVASSNTDPKDMFFAMLCFADPVVETCWRVMLLAEKVEKSVACGDAPGAGLAAFRLGQLVLGHHYKDIVRDANLGKKVKQGRPATLSKDKILRRYAEIMRESPDLKPVAVLAQEFSCHPRTIYKILSRKVSLP